MPDTPKLLAVLSTLPPEEAVKYMQARGSLSATFSWQDLWQEEHATQFTVSRLARMDLLQDIHDGILGSVNGEVSRRDFLKGIEEILIREGWWGEKVVTDPGTGEKLVTRFDPARLKLIYDINTRQAYSAGLWQRIERNKATSPYIWYITKRDERVRASHRGWDNVTLPVDHPFWNTHYPPNGWRCRCRAMSMSQAEYDKGLAPNGQQLDKNAPEIQWKDWENKRTGAVERVPLGIDPGFGYNSGKAGMRADNLAKVVKDKLASVKNLNGASPRALWNRVVSELAPSEIMKMDNLDSALLADVGAVKAAEYYVRQVREGILKEISQGGIAGSAALKHELTEVAEITKAGLNIYDNGDIVKIIAAFGSAEKTGDPAAHVPWHLVALRAELEYAQHRIQALGFRLSLGEIAMVIYGDLTGFGEEAILKMALDLDAIGEKWPESVQEEVLHAIRDQKNP